MKVYVLMICLGLYNVDHITEEFMSGLWAHVSEAHLMHAL